MNNNIPQEVKDKIINLFLYTRIKILNILKEVSPNQEITIEEFYDILKEYSENTGQKMVRVDKTKQISKEELKDLKAKGLTTNDIIEYFANKGIYTTKTNISNILKSRSKTKKKVDKNSSKNNKLDKGNDELEKLDDEIFELREQGFSYNRIAMHFFKKGIISKMNYEYVSTRCKKIYKEKVLEEPKTIREKVAIPEEIVFELRERNYSYAKIKKYLEKKGIKVSENAVSLKCKEIYEKKGLKSISRSRKIMPDIDLEEDILSAKGDNIQNKGENSHEIMDLEQIDKDRMRSILFNLKESRNATDEQLKKLAEMYGINLYEIQNDSEEFISWYR